MPSKAGNRRGFFRFLARESAVWFDEARGRPQMRLSDLPKLPPDALGELVPQILPGVEIVPKATEVQARRPGETEPVTLFRLEETNLFIFNQLNGRATLGDIVRAVSAIKGLDEKEALARVRALFLGLVRLRVCAPSNVGRRPETQPLDEGMGRRAERRGHE